jgi:hypothetical protein
VLRSGFGIFVRSRPDQRTRFSRFFEAVRPPAARPDVRIRHRTALSAMATPARGGLIRLIRISSGRNLLTTRTTGPYQPRAYSKPDYSHPRGCLLPVTTVRAALELRRIGARTVGQYRSAAMGTQSVLRSIRRNRTIGAPTGQWRRAVGPTTDSRVSTSSRAPTAGEPTPRVRGGRERLRLRASSSALRVRFDNRNSIQRPRYGPVRRVSTSKQDERMGGLQQTTTR